MVRKCSVCSHPRGFEITNQVLLGELDIYSAARELDVTYDVMWKHIRDHIKREFEKEVPKGDYAEVLDELMTKLVVRVKHLLALPVAIENERIISWHIRSINEIINRIAQLRGMIQQAPLVKLTQLTVQVNKITSFLVTNLCEECKQKVIRFLEEVEVEDVKPST